jgi:hypothetical protein
MIATGIEIESGTAFAAAGSLVAAVVALWRMDRASLVDRVVALTADLAAERASHAQTRQTLIAGLQECAELKGRAAALAEEVKHVRDPE